MIHFFIFIRELPLWTSKEANMLNGTGSFFRSKFKKKKNEIKFNFYFLDFTMYPPFLNKKSIPYTFQPDVCRFTIFKFIFNFFNSFLYKITIISYTSSLYLVYNESMSTFNNIETYGYILDENFFANVSVNPYNHGFCTPAGNCLLSGIFNITECVQSILINL